MPTVHLITQAMLAAEGVATPATITPFPTRVDPISGWTMSSTLVGADLEVTFDETPGAADIPGPGSPFLQDSFPVKYLDADGEVGYFYINHHIRPQYVAPNIPPVGVDDGITIDAGANSDILVTVNDTDADGSVAAAILNPASVDPALTVTAGPVTGSFNVAVAPGTPAGDYTFQYQPEDNESELGNMTTVTINVPAPNQPPVGVPDAATIDAGATQNVVVITNDSDPDGTVVDAVLIPASVPPELTVVAGAAGSFDVTVAPGTAAGDYTFQYTAEDDDAAVSGATLVTITVPPSLGEIYYEGQNLRAGEDFVWIIGSPQNNVEVKKADGTVVGSGASGTITVPAGDEGETYYVVDDTPITNTWLADVDGDQAMRHMTVVNPNLNVVFGRSMALDIFELSPGLTYPNLTLVNINNGSLLEQFWMDADLTNGNIRINVDMDPAAGATQQVHLPTTSNLMNGGNIGTVNVRNVDAANMPYFSWRMGGNPTAAGVTLADIPDSTYSQQLIFISSSITGMTPLNPATFWPNVNSTSATNSINFNGTATGWAFGDETDVYSIDHWLTQMVAAGRDTTGVGRVSEIGEWGGDLGGYGTTVVLGAAGTAAANAMSTGGWLSPTGSTILN